MRLVGRNVNDIAATAARRGFVADAKIGATGQYRVDFLGLVMVVFLVLGGPLVSFFSDRPDTTRHGVDALRIISYGYIFYAWGMVMTQAFNGAGDTMTPSRINLVCFWCLQIPLAWALSQKIELGPSGVFWSVALAESVLAVVSIAVFRRGRWKEVQLSSE